MRDALQLQVDEFRYLAVLVEQNRRLSLTAVVDDDYPSVRHDYEGALRHFIRAVKLNRGNDYANP